MQDFPTLLHDLLKQKIICDMVFAKGGVRYEAYKRDDCSTGKECC